MKSRVLTALLIAGAAMVYGCAHTIQPGPAAVVPSPVDLSRIKYDSQCFTIDGKDTFLYSGSFHYFRCPKPLWADRFQKMKDAGLNCVETYVAWNWHEQQPPADVNDFSKVDMTDLKDWLDMAINRFGFYVILRPGPYICAEWDGGGYPQWLVTKRPADIHAHWLRGDDKTYLEWCKHWYAAAAKAAVPYQITHMPAGKPGVIFWQIENEYNYANFTPAVKLRQLLALAHDSRDLGIDVPLITCQTDNPLYKQDPYLQQNVIECRNTYPRFDAPGEKRALMELDKYQPDKPRMITELQGGWFSDVGDKLSEDMGYTAQHINHVTILAWALGYTGTNYYMMFGGTNIGDWGAANKTTTYDYAAPIREWGGVGPRYFAVQGMANFLKEHSGQLIRSESVDVSVDPSSDDLSIFLRRDKDGNRFLFVFNNRENDRAAGTIHVTCKEAGIDGSVAYALDPFDAKILYLPAGESDLSKGKWYPEPVAAPERPTDLPGAITIASARRQVDPGALADSWRDLPSWGSIEDMGIFDRRYVFYRAKLPPTTQPGTILETHLPGQDSCLAQLNDAPLAVRRYGRGVVSIALPKTSGDAGNLLLLYENGGRDNGGDAIDARCGIINAAVSSSDVLPIILPQWSMKLEDGDTTADITAVMDSSWKDADVSGRPDQLIPRQTGVFRAQIDLTPAEFSAGPRVLVFGSLAPQHTVYFNGKEVSPVEKGRYDVSSLIQAGLNNVAVVATATSRSSGIGGGAELDPAATSAPSSLAWQISGESAGFAGKWWDNGIDDSKWDSINIGSGENSGQTVPPAQLTWYRLHFDLPAPNPHVWAPWKLHLNASGNGFIYLNGHALGRYWEVGPQFDFFLPECWLNFGPGSTNVVTLCLRPTKGQTRIHDAVVSTYSDFAESR